MLPEWVYWTIIIVLIVAIGFNLSDYNNLKKEYKNEIKHYEKRLDRLSTTAMENRKSYMNSTEENTQLKLYLYQNISDYYKRNPDKKN